MELQDAINARRSIRAFQDKKIPKEILIKLIDSATKAHSACNKQPWIFYFLDNKEKRDKISKILLETFKTLADQNSKKSQESQKLTKDFYADLGGAPNTIFIFRKKAPNEPIWAESMDIKSISCAAQNLMLSAVELGLGTCWIGTFEGGKIEQEVKKILGTKENEQLISSIVIGYPKKDHTPR